MPWHDLPPGHHARLSTAEALAGVVTLVATPLFAAVWLLGPPALVVLFHARGQDVLAAIAAPIALWWLSRMVREPMVLGVLFSTPYAAFCLVQRWRGKIHSDELAGEGLEA